jgi:hypothetical protein
LELQDSISLIEVPAEEMNVDLPEYYKEGFFSKDSLFHPELEGRISGSAGNPVPYNVRGDDIITSLLLTFFVLAVIAYSNIRGFFTRQAKNFFYTPREGVTTITETATEARFQMFIVVLTSLMFSILYYFYSLHYNGDTYILSSQYYLILIFWAIFLLYFLVKVGLFTLVNLVFFDGKRNRQWIKSLLLVMALEGLLSCPAIIMGPYFDMSIQKVEIYFAIMLILVKIVTFYKCYIIFFRQNVVGLQIILYLCALEIVPLMVLWNVLDITANSLKINF